MLNEQKTTNQIDEITKKPPLMKKPEGVEIRRSRSQPNLDINQQPALMLQNRFNFQLTPQSTPPTSGSSTPLTPLSDIQGFEAIGEPSPI